MSFGIKSGNLLEKKASVKGFLKRNMQRFDAKDVDEAVPDFVSWVFNE